MCEKETSARWHMYYTSSGTIIKKKKVSQRIAISPNKRQRATTLRNIARVYVCTIFMYIYIYIYIIPRVLFAFASLYTYTSHNAERK